MPVDWQHRASESLITFPAAGRQRLVGAESQAPAERNFTMKEDDETATFRTASGQQHARWNARCPSVPELRKPPCSSSSRHLCLKINFFANRSGNPLSLPGSLPTRHGTHRTLRHASGISRIASSRGWVLCLAIAGGSILAAFSAEHMMHRMEVAAAPPLAPAPAPPAPPQTHKKHHFLSNGLHGLASWYGSVWNGRTTASGERYDESRMTAAHKSLPLGTLVRVTNLASMRSVVVRINDRGAMTPNCIIDLSSAAAREIGMMNKGLAHVSLEVIGKL